MTHLRSQPSIGITARDLVVDYHGARGTVRALDCPALDIGAGASVAVMGPSGCGKSTLLGLLAGLALPTQGVVQIGDQRISALDEHARVAFRRRVLGVVYQADNLLPHLTVEENVALQMVICRSGQQSSGLPATALPTRGARPTPDGVLARLGLAALASRMPDQLSGGQRQRVAVARAIVHGPSVLLADEPTGALDEASADTVIRLLVEVHHQMGSTLVVVTHDPAIAAHLDRTIHLSDAH